METYQGYCNGCSGAFIGTPGVFGSSINSASGGLALPSILNDLAIASLALISFNEGIFLYPLITFSFSFSPVPFSVPFVSWFSFSNPSFVSGSPTPSTSERGVPDLPEGGVTLNLPLETLLDLVELGTLTARESAFETFEALVLNEVVEPVRSRDATNRGRPGVLFVDAVDEDDCALLVKLIRAASSLREGPRPGVGRSAFTVDIAVEVIMNNVGISSPSRVLYLAAFLNVFCSPR
jgi:hypothetical protein